MAYRARVRGVEVILRPLTVVFFAVAWYLGSAAHVLAAVIALVIHEGAHILAARMLGISVGRVALSPFGGMAGFDDVFELQCGKEAAIAMAGPAANILAVMAALTICEYFGADADSFRIMINANLSLALFNLAPAFPLDGGRLVRAALGAMLPIRTATRAAGAVGVAAALCLAAVGAYGLWLGRANITVFTASAYMLAASARAVIHSDEIKMRAIVRDMVRVGQKPVPIRRVAVRADAGPAIVLGRLRYGVLYEIVVVDSDQRMLGVVSQAALRQAALSGVSLRGLIDGQNRAAVSGEAHSFCARRKNCPQKTLDKKTPLR